MISFTFLLPINNPATSPFWLHAMDHYFLSNEINHLGLDHYPFTSLFRPICLYKLYKLYKCRWLLPKVISLADQFTIACHSTAKRERLWCTIDRRVIDYHGAIFHHDRLVAILRHVLSNAPHFAEQWFVGAIGRLVAFSRAERLPLAHCALVLCIHATICHVSGSSKQRGRAMRRTMR